ncbi:crotonobetaine/carnitine-CoA ligase [compost metagenome]
MKVFVVLRDGVPPDDTSLQNIIAGCQANLAKFKVPRYYSFIQELPKTASLKIAKATLRERAADLSERTYDNQAGQWLTTLVEEKSA